MPALFPRPPTFSRNAKNRASAMVMSGRVIRKKTLCQKANLISSSLNSRT
jgi:hypothetical protein